MVQEMLVLVDDNDVVTGEEEKLKVHQLGLLHRAFSIFLFDDAGRLLLQKRADTKYHAGGLWTNTCCGHPRPGESTPDAARRRLYEEMGIRHPALAPVSAVIYCTEVPVGLIEHEYDHVFFGHFTSTPHVNPQEVSTWKWVTREQLLTDVSSFPDRYTPWFRIMLQKNILNSYDSWVVN